MDNLSGGEKTVAALALLFSIHRYVYGLLNIHEYIDTKFKGTLVMCCLLAVQLSTCPILCVG